MADKKWQEWSSKERLRVAAANGGGRIDYDTVGSVSSKAMKNLAKMRDENEAAKPKNSVLGYIKSKIK